MPTLARPDVDVLDGLTTAIIVDQERMGANPRSTVGTATDANAMLRILFSRLGQPHIGPPTAFSFNVPTRKASGVMSTEKGGRVEKSVVRDVVYQGGMCPRCEGMGSVTDFDLTALYDDSKSLNEGALTIPGYSMDGWYGRIFSGCRLLRPGQADQQVHQEGAARPALQGADQDQGRGHQPHLRGPDPEDPEVDAVQGRRRACSRTSAPSSSGRSPSRPVPTATAPGSARRPGPRRSTGRTSPTSARCRSATWPTGCASLDEPSVAPLLAGLQHLLDSFAEIGLGYLSLDRPAGTLSGRRGAAHQDDPPPRVVAHRRHLRLRRADDRAAPARHRADERACCCSCGTRATPCSSSSTSPRRSRSPTTSSTSAPAPARRGGTVCFEGTVEGLRGSDTITGRHLDDRATLKDVGAYVRRARWRSAARRPTTSGTSTSTSRSGCSACSPASPAPARAR